jgi:Fe-S-cluster formation regulator IscX/YfhJ
VACDKFIYIEIISQSESSNSPLESKKSKTHSNTKSDSKYDKVDKKLINLIKLTIDDLADDSEWAFLARVGGLLNKKKPDFDPRNYGFSKLTPMIKSLDSIFEIEERDVENRSIKHVFVRIKK